MKNNFSSSISASINGRGQTPPKQEKLKSDVKNSRNQHVEQKPTVNKKKHAGGRPTNASKGKNNRRQVSLTLPPDFYDDILDAAAKEEISFAMYVERALKEYLSLHE